MSSAKVPTSGQSSFLNFHHLSDKELLYEEAPQAYKDIEQVMQDMIDHGLIKVIAILRPVMMFAFCCVVSPSLRMRVCS